MEAGEIAPLCVMGGASDQASHPQTGNPRSIAIQIHFLNLNCQFDSDRNRFRRFLQCTVLEYFIRVKYMYPDWTEGHS